MSFSTITHPKIGIRPIIDGRRNGVRESLEDRTMQMAKSVAEFLSNTLRYPDGKPVECIIADTTIGGVAEANRCAQKFKSSDVGLTISVTPCWCYGTETIDMDPLMPKAIWGFNGTERPGAVYLAAALAGHSQLGLPAFGIYGEHVQDKDDSHIPADVQKKLIQFAKAGLAVAQLREKSYLSVGSVSMGIAGSVVIPELFRKYLGMRNEYVDMTEIIRRIDRKIYDEVEYEKALNWVKANCAEGKDLNAPEMTKTRAEKDEDWAFVVKMTLIIRDLMIGNPKLAELGYIEESEGHQAILSGFQGQRHWTDHFPNGDFMEAVLNSSFDWNGTRSPLLVATENDSLNGVSMLMGYLLTNTAQLFSDVRTFWSKDAVKRVTGFELEGKAAQGIIHLINSGATCLDATGRQSENGMPAIKPFWNISEEEVQDCLNHTTWDPADRGYFRGGGYSSCFLTKGDMPVTMCRINWVNGMGPVLQIAEGYTVELPQDVHAKLDERTNPTWPTTWFAPRLTGKGPFTSVYEVMNHWGANHGAISYGHIGSDLITMASMLRIPVCMHNVPEEDLFRPSSWNAFGMDTESADFRACQNFGPLYGR